MHNTAFPGIIEQFQTPRWREDSLCQCELKWIVLIARPEFDVGVLMKPERNRSDPAGPDSMRTLRLIGATAALLAVLGIAILVFWFVIRAPRF
jgi:hypothetical protein